MISYIYKVVLLVMLFFTNHAQSSYEPVQEIKPGLFVASKSVDGQTLHFALQNKPESITSFRDFVFNVGASNNKSLRQAISYALGNCKQFGQSAFLDSVALDVYNESGLDTIEKKTNFVEYVCGSKSDLGKLYRAVESIKSGANHVERPGQDMFAWISTDPITDYRDFGYSGSARHEYKMDIEKAYTSNRDLVLLVSASFHNVEESKLNQYVNVVGIFKPPHEILYGNHKNLSLMFHGFIAHASKTLGKRVYHILDPTYFMSKILQDVFVMGEPYRGVNASIKDLYGDIDAQALAKEYGGPVFANIDRLERFFTESK